MPNPFDVQVPNIYQALLAGEQGYKDMSGIMTQRAQDAARQEASQALQSGDTRGALARLIGANDPKNASVLSSFQTAQNAQSGVYGTPIYGTDANGRTVLGAITKSGAFKPLDTGGVNIQPGVKVISTPQGEYVINNRSGAPMGGSVPPGNGVQPQGGTPGFYPKDYRGPEADKKLGAATGEKQAIMGQAKAALDNSISNIDRLARQAYEVANSPGLEGITGIQGIFPSIPGGRAANAQAKLDTLKSQAGFAVLQAMRDASKTGGALGQVSDFENRQLQNNLAELQQSQSADQIKAALKKIVDWADGVKSRLRQAYETDYGNLNRPQQNNQPSAGPGQNRQNIPRIPKGMTPEQVRKRYPPGTPVILPDGSQGVVP